MLCRPSEMLRAKGNRRIAHHNPHSRLKGCFPSTFEVHCLFCWFQFYNQMLKSAFQKRSLTFAFRCAFFLVLLLCSFLSFFVFLLFMTKQAMYLSETMKRTPSTDYFFPPINSVCWGNFAERKRRASTWLPLHAWVVCSMLCERPRLCFYQHCSMFLLLLWWTMKIVVYVRCRHSVPLLMYFSFLNLQFIFALFLDVIWSFVSSFPRTNTPFARIHTPVHNICSASYTRTVPCPIYITHFSSICWQAGIWRCLLSKRHVFFHWLMMAALLLLCLK